jgi:hypothetical protein
MLDDGTGKIPFKQGNSPQLNKAEFDPENGYADDPELRQLLRRYTPHPPSSLECRIMASYCQQITRVQQSSSRTWHWAWRFAVIALLATAFIYAAVRVANYMMTANGAKEHGTASNQEQQTPTPKNSLGTNSILLPDSDRAEHKNVIAVFQGGVTSSQQNAITTRAAISPQAPDIGNPTYVPIAESTPVEPGVGSECILTGTVTSEQGLPVPGATVSIHKSLPVAPSLEWPAPVASQTCDAEGRYTLRLNALMPNDIVLAQKEGFVKMIDGISSRDLGMAVKNFVLPVQATCAEGRVFAGENQPLAGAMVVLSVIMGGMSKPEVSPIWSITDESGRYNLPGLPAGVEEGRMRIRASARGFITDNSPIIEFQAGPCKQVDIHLKPANIVSFVVKDRQGAVIPDAAGRLLMSVNSTDYMRKGESAGSLEWIAALDAVPATCTVTAKGYNPVTFTLDPESPPAEIILDVGQTIRGRVVSETGNPVPRARVLVRGTPKLGMSSGSEAPADTDADGRFVLPLANPPVTRVSVTKPGYTERQIVFDTQPAPPVLEIQLQFEGAGIFGNVLDSENRPVRRFTITFRSLEGTGSTAFMRDIRSENGEFSVRDIPPGVYTLHIKLDTDIPKDQPFEIPRIEIRRGYNYGLLKIRLQPIEVKK